MELVSSRDEFPFLKIFTVHPLSSLLSPMWQKLPYICNNFFHYSNLRITFLNYCTIEKSPSNPIMSLWMVVPSDGCDINDNQWIFGQSSNV